MPRKLSPLRIALLRIFGARIADPCLVESARIWVPWNLYMDEFSVIGDGAEIYNLAPVRIGANTVISQRAYLCTASHDYTKSASRSIRGRSRLARARGLRLAPLWHPA